MAKGIEVPIQVHNGRMKLSEGDEYIDSLILTALGNGESTNPFQFGIGLGEFMIFEINDGLTEGEIKTRTLRVFESLETDQLAELEDLTFDSKNSEKSMDLTYRNLETGARNELEVPLSE